MRTINADDDSLRRIAHALERIADQYAPQTKTPNTDNYAETKNDLAQTVIQAIRDATERGTLPPNVLKPTP